ncbi:subunit A of linear gramicidin synthase [Paenibacillus sp. 32O-W]|nr:subunit A of linear gramicidin synthase [Paenibacillus sp. 32O-W]
MNVLWLGPFRENLTKFIEDLGDRVYHWNERLVGDEQILADKQFLISYGYRFILPDKVLRHFQERCRVNLHISYLPWNRGADPNLWSFLDNTPKGVSIHLLSSGLDKGDLIVQQTVEMSETDTLRTSYNKLTECIERLFMEYWPKIRTGRVNVWPQPAGGSYHRSQDKRRYEHLLTAGWDTPVEQLVSRAEKKGVHE